MTKYHTDSEAPLDRSATTSSDGIGRSATEAAYHMTHLAAPQELAWSVHHLPEPKIPLRLRLSVIAVAFGLAAAVLATTVSSPINTAGIRMEPKRFQAAPTAAPIAMATTRP